MNAIFVMARDGAGSQDAAASGRGRVSRRASTAPPIAMTTSTINAAIASGEARFPKEPPRAT
jgi:hypothetical protein